MVEAILSRRVTRAMTGEPVDPGTLDRIVAAAAAAPNAGNRRLQSVLVVTEPRRLRLLRLVSPGMLPLPTAALVIAVDEDRAEHYGFRPDAPGLLIDVGTAAATILLAAHGLGIGACPVTSFSAAAVSRILDLAPSTKPRLIVCLGHAGPTQPAPMRR